ncbi:hypothetical protein AMTRI_Chr12g235970 [Amborella trichopoda]
MVVVFTMSPPSSHSLNLYCSLQSPSLITNPTLTRPPHLQLPDRIKLLLGSCKTASHLVQIHASILRNGLDRNPLLQFKLLRSYSSSGLVNQARLLFDQVHEPNVFFWTAIIRGCALNGLYKEAILLYYQMQDGGVEPNAYTFSSLLKAFSMELLVREGEAAHGHVLKLQLGDDSFVQSSLIDMYARFGKLEAARQLFDQMLHKSIVSYTAMITCYTKRGELDDARMLFDEMNERDAICWNAIIDGYTQHGHFSESLTLFQQMLSENIKPNEVTMLSVLSACAHLGALDSGKWLHAYIDNNGFSSNLFVSTALIDMYCKCGSLEDARSVFNAMLRKDVVAWNAMVIGYAMHGQTIEALKLFNRMCGLGLTPTDITFIGLLNACSHAGFVNEGQRLLQSMKEEYGIEPKIEHYGCMVDLLGRAGHLEEAYNLVKGMSIEPDPVIWGALLSACKLHGNVKLGKSISEFIVQSGNANSGTYVLLSNIYAAAGNWEEVARVRTLMRESGIVKEPGCSSIEVDNKIHEFVAGDLKHPKVKEIYDMMDKLNSLLKSEGYIPQTNVVFA